MQKHKTNYFKTSLIQILPGRGRHGLRKIIVKRQNLNATVVSTNDVAAIILRRKARRVRECTSLTRASRRCERVARTEVWRFDPEV